MPSSVVACLGSDLAHAPARDRIRQAVAGGATCLGLDSAAIAGLGYLGIAPTTYDDWLDETARREMLRVRGRCADEWYAAGQALLTVDGVCWPDLDSVMLSGFWEEHALQLALAQAFEASDVQHLVFWRSRGTRPSLHRSPADTFGATWEQVLRQSLELEVHDAPSPRAPGARSFAVRAVGRIRRTAGALRSGPRRPSPTPTLRGRVFLTVGEDETARFTHHLRELDAALPTAACVLEPDWATAVVRGASWGVPVLPGPALVAADVAEQFVRGVQQVQAAAAGQPWESALAGCPAHFEHYARLRWPRLVGALRGWEQRWQRLSPRAVVVSSLDDARSQLPAIAAGKAGVPSAALPHAAFYVKTRAAVSSDVLLYETALQRASFVAAGVRPDVLLPYLPPVAATSTPVPPRPSPRAVPGRVRILALTNPVNEDHPGRAISDWTVGHREQLEALKALVSPPADLGLELELHIKPHPLYPDVALLAAAGPAVESARVGADTDLASELASCDVVVGVNYVGSALASVAAAGRPLVNLWTSALLRSESPNPYAHLVARQGPVARDRRELWQRVAAAARPVTASGAQPPPPLFGLDAADTATAKPLPAWLLMLG